MRKVFCVVITVLLVILSGFIFIGCESRPADKTSAHEVGQKATEEMVSSIVRSDSLPKITRSLDREALKKRAEFLNQPNRVGYVYLLSEAGQLIREVQVLGKVTSLNSYLTPMEEIKLIDNMGKTYSAGTFPGTTKTPNNVVTVEAPDLDGTYGENDRGIFWFTPDNVYQEWNGMYLYSSERMTFTVKPLLVERIQE